MARSMPTLGANIGGATIVWSVRRIVLTTGIVGGLLFVIHASFPYVQSWPMIWPALAGATAVWLATREESPHRVRTGAAAALLTGLVLAATAFVGLAIVIAVVLHTDMFPAIRQSGAPRGLLGTSSIIAIAASLAAIDLVVAFVAGLVMLPVRFVQARHEHA